MTTENDALREAQIDWIFERFEKGAALGQSVEASANELMNNPFAPPPPQDLIDEARKRFNRTLGHVSEYESLETLQTEETETGQWYTGPKEKTHIYWPHVKKQIMPKLGDAIEDVDRASSKILASLRPPGEDEINVRGLVLGYVQSGKTTNFVSLIAKAADMGYRLVIVLAGLTDNLRIQTQKRLQEQLISGTSGWVELTTDEEDFGSKQLAAHKTNAKNYFGTPSNRMIAVVKKNGHILTKLNDFLASNEFLTDQCPILIIDDESDQASINVSAKAKEEVSKINAQIRQLLRNKKVAYVAYTATPFANILVDPNNKADIYPRDFIHVLPKPKGYFGTESIFGREPLAGEDDFESDGLDMIRTIEDHEIADTRPPGGKNAMEQWDPQIPESLHAAIRWFIMATAARHARGQSHSHSSMLVHTAVRTQAHEVMAELVQEQVRILRATISKSQTLEVFENEWNLESSSVDSTQFGQRKLSFSEIKPYLEKVLNNVEVIMDNGISEARLKYEDNVPLTAIAVGGNTLARGLTLEGLVCSYFVRNASAYDTLLQMGRWFGFRFGYQDLPRIWMTEELQGWFRDLALVEADLRQDLSRYAREGITPLDFQARIRTHPSMEVTAKAKQQDSRPANVSFSGAKVQTILFKHKDSNWLERNIVATQNLVAKATDQGATDTIRPNGTHVLNGVAPRLIEEFFEEYQIYEGATLGRDNARTLRNYIEMEHKARSIREWDISFYGKRSARDNKVIDLGLSSPLALINRSQMNNSDPRVANIKTLVGSLDRLNAIDFDPATRAEIQKKISQSDKREADLVKTYVSHKGSDVGHLVIYAIDPDSTTSQSETSVVKRQNRRKNLEAVETMIGIGIFFPPSSIEGADVEYVSAQEVIDQETLDRMAEAEEEIRLITEQGNDEGVENGS